ncbi:hypothetical protein DWQ67_03280 [Galactobacter caseinivorans]|uniref:ATP/GTP-binding protein n=1 Tax=Galactobacter caseinivorans TaxID=2676123 RepID=A0A496PMV4_9MICC|nr:hypothetical protein DWQ67_03280 [Galactobacter caseinivorans]
MAHVPRSNHPKPRRSSGRSSQRPSGRQANRPVTGGGWDLDGQEGWRHHGLSTLQHFADGSWHVRAIPSYAAAKEYRCPGCQQVIRPGVSHVVTWRADGPRSDAQVEADRRHWHQRCWENHSPRR